MKAENSGLLALAELRELESNRLARIEEARGQEARARQAQLEAAQRLEAEAALREAAAQREAAQRAMEQRRQLELEEQRRLDQVAAQARLEQQTRIRAEAERLEQQMRAAERAASPRWPYAVVPVLVAMLGFAGVKAWHDGSEADRIEQANAEQRTSYDQQMAAVAGRLDALAAKQQVLERERVALEQQLAAATSDAERRDITARVEAIDRQLSAPPEAAGTTTKPKPKPRPQSVDTKRPTPETKPPTTRKPIVIGDGKDPLDGLD